MIPAAVARPRPTTFGRISLLLALGVGGAAVGSEPVSEANLVRRYLDAPVAQADLEAAEAGTRADRTAVSLLDDPTVEARHEVAGGDAGATTDAIGGSVTVDLGLAPLAYSRAGRLRGQAGEARRQAVVLAAVCDVRADAVDLWAGNRAAAASEAAQARLDALSGTIAALAASGEASGYDRDRAALAVVAHTADTADRRGAAEGLRARLSALVGGAPVTDVALGDVADPPDRDAAVARVGDHPALRALTLERDAARVARDGARRDQLPDLTVSGAGRWDAPTGGAAAPGFEVGGAVQIPWTNGGRAAAREQTAAHAEAEARLIRARAELEATVRAAHQRVEALAAPPVAVDPEAVWVAATARYAAGEASLDDLLQVAEAVEAARVAEVERERLRRRAALDLSCATGRFAEPAMQSFLEEGGR